ncbi:cation:proton antiporter [Pyrococcus abyssi]|uniref:Na+/H+ antiporter n=1 Tax=Pyrococcus abyssi (strain GE5 / Orsay) TaxID=272844 RepID=Q9UY43_PYRAB|nr:cation:proton antiporter [Pyrococcus abyssi]CAB50569.1 napA-3 Na+/H+ antiporter [Pyrococcus abyssi GE5]CCE71133.1 TPA: Na+/H+ antiporter [Pyrococcus abyssi GE5]
MEVFLELAIILVIAKIFGYLSVRLGFPAALGQLLGGVIIGPSLLDVVEYGSEVRLLSELGVVMLLFLAGLETDVEEFKHVGLSAFIVAVMGVFVPFLLGYLVSVLHGYGSLKALFFGGVLTATSVGLTTSILMDMKKLRTKVGTTILAAAIVDDVLGIVILTLLVAMSSRGKVEVEDIEIILLEVAIFFILGILIGHPLVKEVLTLSERITLPETVTTFAIVIMLIFAYLAEKFQLAGITGAYLAGLLVSMTEGSRKITDKIMTIGYSLFIPIFLVSIGIETDIRVLTHAGVFALVYSLIAVVGKIIGCGFGALVARFKPIEAIQVGIGMIPRMEVALIIANVGLKEGILTRGDLAVPVTMVVITTLITPFLLKWAFSKG